MKEEIKENGRGFLSWYGVVVIHKSFVLELIEALQNYVNANKTEEKEVE